MKIGLIGCGAAGVSHLNAMQTVKSLNVVAVCDINQKFAKRVGKSIYVPFYFDAEKMMKEVDLDAVAVITTADSHYKVATLAAKYDLHVMIEKPLTLKVAEGEILVKLFKKKNLLLGVTFTYRYVNTTRKMKKIIDSGKIGKIVEIRHVAWGGFPEKHPAGTEARVKYDRMYEKDIRGILFDCGVHTFDLFRWFSGEEYVKFIGMGACHMGYDYPDSGTVLCEMTNGVRCIYDHGSLPYYLGGAPGICLSMVSVAGTKGSLVWKIVNSKENGEFLAELQINTEKGAKITKLPIFSKCRDAQYRDFVKSVKKGMLCGQFPDPNEANIATRSAHNAVNAVMKNLIR